MKYCRVAALLLAFLLVMAAPALSLSPSGTTYRGIDVSRYQGRIDFAKVKADGIEYVYIRAGEGSGYTDPYFEQNYANAKAAGLRIGFYYYVTAQTVSEGTSQGKRFASLVAGKDYDCRLAMDFEDLSGLTRAEVNDISMAFLTALTRESGNAAVVYSDWSNAQDIFGYALSEYPLWIAETGVSEPRDLNAWSEWVGWQHSSSGTVPGISGNVDLDYFTEGILLPGVSPTPTPEPTATPTPTPEPTVTPTPTHTPEPTVTPTPTHTPEPTVTPTPTPIPDTFVIVIQRGDFLYAIAQRYATTVDTLASINGIANPNLIYAGDNLTVVNVPDPNEGHATYTVRAGDTLSAIARKYGLSAAEIASLNGIANMDRIYCGQVLRMD